jgi:hypothetical protein
MMVIIYTLPVKAVLANGLDRIGCIPFRGATSTSQLEVIVPQVGMHPSYLDASNSDR